MARDRGQNSRLPIEDWEQAAIEYWARRAPEVSHREELRAELVRKLLALRAERRRGIQNQKAYVRAALANAAKAWLKDLSAAKAIVSLDQSAAEEDPREPRPLLLRMPGRDEGDFGTAFRQFWEDLGPPLQRFLTVLEQKNWKLSAAAKTLRIHRNTAALWLKTLRVAATHHGLGD